MKLIVGFGNPGNQYNFTRHNFGFLALDFYCKVHQINWEKTPKFNAIWARIGDTFLIKPQSFYNDSGKVVKSFMNFYKIPPDDLLIICDDFELEFGKTRYRAKGSAGGNNGLKSVIAELGTEDFPRLRLGTGNDELRHKIGDIDFVLSKFTDTEREQLPAILASIDSHLGSALDL